MKLFRRLLQSCLALALAAALWLPCVHLLFARGNTSSAPREVSPQVQALAARHLEVWTDPQLKTHELQRMRRSNAEWDFMGRSFLVWALADLALREPARAPGYLEVMDTIIAETMKLEREEGIYVFLMGYAKARPFVQQPARSLFLDSEIALMLAVRRVVQEKPEYRPLLAERVQHILDRMQRSPVLAAESYPDECWLFDHAIGLAAVRLADHLDGSDHAAFLRAWVTQAKQRLIHAESGLLVSSYTTDGTPLDGPEGSSIWMAAHCLRLIDEPFARDQYQRARRELGRELMGFAWSREWPVSWRNGMDIDSGLVVPVIDASPGGSGLAFVGARSFGDDAYLHKLQTTLEFAAFPLQQNGRLKYCASNQVGDAVLLYASVLGPIWDRVLTGGKR